MTRAVFLIVLGVASVHAQSALPPPPPPAPEPTYAEPPEEDETLSTPTVYTFNPLRAKGEINTGDFYMKRGNYRGAAARFREATQWDDGNEEGFFKWGEASEKLKDYDAAREAFGKFASITTDKKKAEDARKRIAKYPKDNKPPVTKAEPPLIPPPGYPVPGRNMPGQSGQRPGQIQPGQARR